MAESASGPSPFSDFKQSVRAASTEDLNLELMSDVIDGVGMVYGQLFLAKDQALPEENGIWQFRGVNNSAVRGVGGQGGQLSSGAMVAIEEGVANADKVFMLTTDGNITVEPRLLHSLSLRPLLLPLLIFFL